MVKNRKKMIIVLAAALFIMAAVGIFAYTTYSYNNKKYSSYEVVTETARVEDGVVSYEAYQDAVLKYSRDGASAFDATGKEIFNGAYTMKNPVGDVCGTYVVIADQDEKQFVVFNGSDSGTTIETTLPIVKARISSTGIVAVLLEDTQSNVIQLYNPYSSDTKLVAEVPTNIDTEGYPVDFDLSYDGESLVTDFMLPTKGSASYHVSFYNFSAVGQEKNQLVGAKTYENQAVGKVEFVSDEYACVYLDNGIELYSHFLKPEVSFTKTFEDKVDSILVNEDYICVIMNKMLTISSLSGKELLTKQIDYEYNDVYLYGKELYFTNELQCVVLRSNGMEKWAGEFKNKVEQVFPDAGNRHYYLLTEQNLQEVNIQ